MTRETLHTDVLIIGAGGAASRAAYEAKRLEPDLKVLIATEGRWGGGGSTVWVASETLGINAPFNAAADGDSPDVFLEDIMTTGLGLTSRRLASVIAQEAGDRIQELIDLGVQFDRDGGRLRQRKLSGCTRARSLAQGGRTGVSILENLKRAALEQGVQALEGIRILDLIVQDGAVRGARGFKEHKQIDILAGAVILASGGAGAVFLHHINHPSLRGDGFAMAYRAGARLTNMEFFQIGPGVVFPKMDFIIHSHMWNFRPRLRNAAGRKFLEDYLPAGIAADEVLSLKSMSFPFSVRTHARYLDIAISKELLAGRGTENGGVVFDVNHVAQKHLMEKAPITFDTFLKRGIDLSRDSIEIAPLVQNFNGGVQIDENAAATIPGLYAVGEVSGGVHGADRPGGNNLTDCQVFGYRGGRAAAAFAKARGQSEAPAPQVEMPSAAPDKAALAEIRRAMDRALMVVRHEAPLQELLERIRAYRRASAAMDSETDNLLLVAEMLARSALFRRESRGVHFREDFPDRDENFAQPSQIFRSESGEMRCALV